MALYSTSLEHSPNAGVFERSRKAAQLHPNIIATIAGGASPTKQPSRYVDEEDRKSVRSAARSLTISTK